MDKQKTFFFSGIVLLSLLFFSFPSPGFGQEDVRTLREEIRKMREDSEKQRQQIKALEEKLERMDTQSAQKTKELEEKVVQQTSSWVDRYLKTQTGDSRFLLTGYGFGNYVFRGKHGNQNEKTNTFQAGFVPIFLYRVNDWIFFESELEVELENGETEVNLEYAQANFFLNDYMTLGVGKYLIPFGEFIEREHAVWINKLVSFPLPYREEGGLLPFSQVGAQLRGVFPLGNLTGAEIEYSTYVANGPRFESAERGAALDVNDTDNNSPKAWGGRIGFRPFPFDWEWGRLKLGASTYNGVWRRGRWLNAWGLDWSYQKDLFELHGEYLGLRRQMFSGEKADNRNGWYLQGSYKLSSVPIRFIDRSELVMRFSGVNQPKNPDEEFAKMPRQFTLGWNYWFTPSVVWKLEYDRDFPRGDKAGNQFLSQIAVGF